MSCAECHAVATYDCILCKESFCDYHNFDHKIPVECLYCKKTICKAISATPTRCFLCVNVARPKSAMSHAQNTRSTYVSRFAVKI